MMSTGASVKLAGKPHLIHLVLLLSFRRADLASWRKECIRRWHRRWDVRQNGARRGLDTCHRCERVHAFCIRVESILMRHCVLFATGGSVVWSAARRFVNMCQGQCCSAAHSRCSSHSRRALSRVSTPDVDHLSRFPTRCDCCSPKCFKEKHFTSKIRSRVESHDAGQEDGANTSQQPRRDTVGNRSSVMGMFGVEQSAATGQRGKKTFRAKSDKLKDRQFTKRPVRTLPVYDLAPDVRPLVIVGPSAPGYEVTDKMQYALVSYLLKSFSQHCVKVRYSLPSCATRLRRTLAPLG